MPWSHLQVKVAYTLVVARCCEGWTVCWLHKLFVGLVWLNKRFSLIRHFSLLNIKPFCWSCLARYYTQFLLLLEWAFFS